MREKKETGGKKKGEEGEEERELDGEALVMQSFDLLPVLHCGLIN